MDTRKIAAGFVALMLVGGSLAACDQAPQQSQAPDQSTPEAAPSTTEPTQD